MDTTFRLMIPNRSYGTPQKHQLTLFHLFIGRQDQDEVKDHCGDFRPSRFQGIALNPSKIQKMTDRIQNSRTLTLTTRP